MTWARGSAATTMTWAQGSAATTMTWAQGPAANLTPQPKGASTGVRVTCCELVNRRLGGSVGSACRKAYPPCFSLGRSLIFLVVGARVALVEGHLAPTAEGARAACAVKPRIDARPVRRCTARKHWERQKIGVGSMGVHGREEDSRCSTVDRILVPRPNPNRYTIGQHNM
jgi:hypothetical protein